MGQMTILSMNWSPRGFMPAVFFSVLILLPGLIQAQEDIDVGKTGWDVKRPVMASACDNGCPWGELGDFVKDSLKPYGYSVILCRNCNRFYGPRLVSENDYPPALDEINLEDGVNVRIDARIDFGVTSSAMLSTAYHRTLANEGPYPNLRLIAKIFDFYFLELPDELLKLIADQNVDAEFVEVQNRLLRGVNRRIKTLGRSGEAIFARDDTPEQAAYDLARAIDENHGALKWFIRVYTYDPETVWQNFGVPLHPGAEKYYREVGYMKENME